jgi:hypothetical protein
MRQCFYGADLAEPEWKNVRIRQLSKFPPAGPSTKRANRPAFDYRPESADPSKLI